MPDQAIVSDLYAALILKTAARVDEYPLSDRNVFSEIRVKGRKERKAFVYLFSDEFAEKFAQPCGAVKGVVDA